MTLDETYQVEEFPFETLDEYDMAPGMRGRRYQ